MADSGCTLVLPHPNKTVSNNLRGNTVCEGHNITPMSLFTSNQGQDFRWSDQLSCHPSIKVSLYRSRHQCPLFSYLDSFVSSYNSGRLILGSVLMTVSPVSLTFSPWISSPSSTSPGYTDVTSCNTEKPKNERTPSELCWSKSRRLT